MTNEERDLVFALATHKLSEADFLIQFRHSSNGRKLCEELLREALHSRIAEDVEWALIVGFTFGFTCETLDSLLELAPSPWHYKHEDVVTALECLNTPKAIEALYLATQWVPDYLDFDDSRALAVKAIWALGHINSPMAEAALNKLKSNSNSILAQAALNQLQRRKSSVGTKDL